MNNDSDDIKMEDKNISINNNLENLYDVEFDNNDKSDDDVEIVNFTNTNTSVIVSNLNDNNDVVMNNKNQNNEYTNIRFCLSQCKLLEFFPKFEENSINDNVLETFENLKYNESFLKDIFVKMGHCISFANAFNKKKQNESN